MINVSNISNLSLFEVDVGVKLELIKTDKFTNSDNFLQQYKPNPNNYLVYIQLSRTMSII